MDNDLFRFGDESVQIFDIIDALEDEGWEISQYNKVNWGDPFECVVDFDNKTILNGAYKALAGLNFFKSVYLDKDITGKYFYHFDDNWKPIKVSIN